MNINVLLLTIILLISSAFSSLQAHEIRPAIIDITLEENQQYRIDIRLNLEAMIAQINPQHKDTKEAKNASDYDALRLLSADDLKQKLQQFKGHLLQGITLLADNQPQNLTLSKANIPEVGDTDLARDSNIILTGQLPPNTQEISWAWSKDFGANVIRVSTPSKPDLYTAYLQNGKASGAINIGNKKSKAQSKLDVFSNYVGIGFLHILPKGLDHILFVVGLFLLSVKIRPLLLQITSFTLAHSITLALGMLGVIQIPASIVEPLIAASIIYVAIENIYSDKLFIWRPVIVFLFGLLHGLGFSSVLAEIGLSSQYFVTGLIAFNVGVELGQLTVIGLCFLTVGFWFRHKPWYRRRISNPASTAIAVIATYWLIERTLLT